MKPPINLHQKSPVMELGVTGKPFHLGKEKDKGLLQVPPHQQKSL